jgi:pyruvate/2-oxoglutarate dehydrogenase complex dihydrolipoamide dehydrogenase (E3) component
LTFFRTETRVSQPESREILVLGSGGAGKHLARHLAAAGHRTAVIERRWIGGACHNVACLPSKNEIWSARVAHLASPGNPFGARPGAITIDMAAVRQRKRAMVEREVARQIQKNEASGVELIMGHGRFVAPKTIEVSLNDGGSRVLTGEKIFLDLGSHAAMPNIPGLAAAQPLTHIEALELDHAPAHLLVLGGGYVGLEFAQAYRRFGSSVTVLEHGPRIMGREDADISEQIERILGEEGIEIIVECEVQTVAGRSGKTVGVTLTGDRRIEGTDILVAAGRVPNTAGIGLDLAGIALDEHGFVRVNDRLETTAPAVWAMGECAGSPHFTHAAADDFRIVRDNLAGGSRSTADRLVPYCMFTDPPLAHVGLSEHEALRRGIAVRVARLPLSGIARARTTDEMRGIMKVLIGADDRILGFTMIGPEAGEVVAVVQIAMLADLPYRHVRDAMIAHPTMAEGLGPLLSGVPAH